MADQLNFMLDQMEQKFDLTFDSKSSKPQGSINDNLLPSDNPEHHSPGNSTASDLPLPEQSEQLEESHHDQQHQTTSVEQIHEISNSSIDIGHNNSSSLCQLPQYEPSPLQNQSFELHISDKRTLSPDRPICFEDQEYEQQEEEELMSYRSLSQKLENALSRLKKTTIPIENQFSARQEQFIRRKRSDLDLLRAEKQKQDSLRYTGKPLLNSKSMQILTNHYKPIQSRYKDVLNEKNKKLEQSMNEKKKKEKEQQQKVISEMKERQQKIKNKLGGQIRTEKQYYDWMQNWTEVRDKKVEEMAFKQGQTSLSTTTFRPNINPRSQVLMKKKPRVPVYEQQPQAKRGGLDKNCTFKPNLTKKLVKK